MTSKTTGYISIMLVALILGLMLAVQYRVVNRAPTVISTDRAKEIADEIKQIDRDREALHKEISDLIYKLEQVNQGKNEAINALHNELEKTRMAAGLLTVTGPGVEVILDNPGERKGSWLQSDVFIISAEDLLKVVNELWGGGAEATSINSQRIISTTEIRFAGPFLNINTVRVVPPYQILAVGDADALAGVLELPGGLAEFLRSLGIEVTVEKHQDLTVPAYTES